VIARTVLERAVRESDLTRERFEYLRRRGLHPKALAAVSGGGNSDWAVSVLLVR
jgi:hypothetical protein